MHWALEWGPSEKDLLEFEAENGITPHALQIKPKLNEVLTYYYDEYNAIAPDRHLDQGHPTPLTTFQIQTYCTFYSVQEPLVFADYIKRIDRIYLDIWYKKRKAETATK